MSTNEQHSAENGAPRMTEAEWERHRAWSECAAYGHEWNIIQTVAGVPIRLACNRPCGTPRYRVVPERCGRCVHPAHDGEVCQDASVMDACGCVIPPTRTDA